MNLLTITLCLLTEVAMIIAKIQRLPATHSSNMNQAKLKIVRLENVIFGEKVLETPGKGYNYTDVMTLITVKRRTSPIRLPIKEIREFIIPIRIPVAPTNVELFGNKIISPHMSWFEDGNSSEVSPPELPPPSRDYLPSKSLYSYNIDTGIRDQKDDRLNHTDIEQMVQA
ncbi:uncharacterized protein [Anoplolepis gracilipes]|uniref:uncharacterized protein isoform X2 n=1 Tax=Anoplolepis gracilipes TaxID=354296 RepID=UPI003BA304D3